MSEREKTIDQVLWALKNLWVQHPEQRLGQLLENYVFPMTLTKQGGRTALTFFQEDEETFKKLILNTDFKHSPVTAEVAINGEKKSDNKMS